MVSTPTGPGETQYPGFWVRHSNGTEFEVKPYTAVVTSADADTALQSLVNHLQDWGDLAADVTVSANKIETEIHAVTSDPDPEP
jgi:hypothetical protein